MKQKYIKVVDIGHSGRYLDEAISDLEVLVSECAHENKIKVIKVITGHGTGKLRDQVRNWCKEQKGRFKGVIYGEEYDMFNAKAVNMREDCKQEYDQDYWKNNSAITFILLW